jgi:hypothetical protein
LDLSSPDGSGNLFWRIAIFSWYKKATAGSSFCALEKKQSAKKIGTNSRISFLLLILYCFSKL